jgi:ectoine hydroxylase-related dioxygenase (phytanoyl-CoA dioxygenase family)
VVYLKCAPKCGDLFFTKCGQDNLAITPEVGKMVLFPSFLKHGVQTNKSNQNRISLAFNLFPFPLPSEEW